MKTIVEGKANICKLLGKQHVKDTQYRLMKYLLRTECEDGTLLHNVITGHFVLLSAEEAQMLDALPAVPSELMTQLIENHFLVPVDCSEKEIVKELRVLMKRLFASKGINNFIILPTTNCNARCYYCFQSDCKRINMSSETADHLVDYMIAKSNGQKIILKWFGGEPLVEVNRINQICSELTARKIDFSSRMISNGFLFSEDLAEKAIRDWKLKTIQITLDGTEEVYNNTKSFVSPIESPFKRVLDNIQILLDKGVYVFVRLNLDISNLVDLKCLADELKKRFSAYDNIHVYVNVILKDTGFSPIARDESMQNVLYKYRSELNNYLYEIGLTSLDFVLPSIKSVSCSADNKKSLVVYPDGRLFLCDIIKEEDQVGHIDSNELFEEIVEKYQEKLEFPTCDMCPLYPNCIVLKKCSGIETINSFSCADMIEKQIRKMQHYFRKMKKTGKNFCMTLDKENDLLYHHIR